jgi:hypothetical protein
MQVRTNKVLRSRLRSKCPADPGIGGDQYLAVHSAGGDAYVKWKYGKKAPEVMRELIQYMDIAIANEEDCTKSLGIQVDADVEHGKLNTSSDKIKCEGYFNIIYAET